MTYRRNKLHSILGNKAYMETLERGYGQCKVSALLLEAQGFHSFLLPEDTTFFKINFNFLHT